MMSIFKSDSNLPSTSGMTGWDQRVCKELVSLDLSVMDSVPINEEEIEEEDDDDFEEVNEDERLQLQKVTSLVDAAYQRVEKFSQYSYQIRSYEASENSSCQSTGTGLLASSLPESLEANKAEIEELRTQAPSLETALRINQALQRKFSHTLNQLENTLQKNIKRQATLNEEIELHGGSNVQEAESKDIKDKYHVRPSTFAMPYFKHRNGTPAPMNEDAKYKVTNGYLDLYSTKLRTWLTSEQNTLVKEVHKEWKSHLVEEWQLNLRDNERKLRKPDLTEDEISEVNKEMEVCKNHISFFSNVPSDKIDIPKDSKLDWNKIAVSGFDGQRTAEECRLMWENQMHPSINHSPFTEEEDVNIQMYMLNLKEEEKPDWDFLLNKLESGRTAFQVFKRWVSFIKPANFPAVWTPETTEKLRDIVTMLRIGSHIPWNQVAQNFTGFTKIQLRSRWRVICNQQTRGLFTLEEDYILLKGLWKFGTNFDLIAHFIKGRTKTQVRYRFYRGLLPGLTTKPWTVKEDEAIIENCSGWNSRWRWLSKLLIRRNVSQIKMRYCLLFFWQALSGKNCLPPPLFPLSLTKNPNDVKFLRRKILKGDIDLKFYLESVKSGNAEEVIRSYEESFRRLNKLGLAKGSALQKGDEEENLGDVAEGEINFDCLSYKGHNQGLRLRRKRCWMDFNFSCFFLPGRPDPSPNFSSRDLAVKVHLHRIAQALQVRLSCDVLSWDDMKLMQTSLFFHDFDVRLINNVLVRHHLLNTYGPECVSCSTRSPSLIPFMPPNLATLGAFRSLLIHKPTLMDMANKNFFLFRVPSSQFYKFADMVSLNDLKYSNKGQEDIEKTPPDKRSKRKMRKAALAVNSGNSRIYSKMKDSSEGQRNKEKVIIDPISPSELNQMYVGHEVHSFARRYVDAKAVEDVIKEEDELLFKRMLSLFFWPALFTMREPSSSVVNALGEALNEKDISEKEFALGSLRLNEKSFTKFPSDDLEEQEREIKLMEAVRSYKNHNFQTPLKRHEIDVTKEDMKRKFRKKKIVGLKRSLMVKRTWVNRRLGIVKPKKEMPEKIATRPRSKRISSLIEKRRKKQEQEEKKLIEMENEEFIKTEEQMELGEENEEIWLSRLKPEYVLLAEQDWISDQEEEL